LKAVHISLNTELVVGFRLHDDPRQMYVEAFGRKPVQRLAADENA
jgi:hypothetical protein